MQTNQREGMGMTNGEKIKLRQFIAACESIGYLPLFVDDGEQTQHGKNRDLMIVKEVIEAVESVDESRIYFMKNIEGEKKWAIASIVLGNDKDGSEVVNDCSIRIEEAFNRVFF